MSTESMVGEWLRIMLEEIARKKAEEAEIRAEEQRRRGEQEEPNARSI
jgi:hypothetical protein